MEVRVNLLDEWAITGERSEHGYDLQQPFKLVYPAPVNAVGWYPIGFEQGNDSAMDAMGWFGMKLVIHAKEEETKLRMIAGFADGRKLSTSSYVAGSGMHEVTVKLSNFEIEEAKNNIWRFLQAFELQGKAELISAVLVRGESIYAAVDIAGKSGEAGETVRYTMNIYNCTETKQHVSVKQLFKGWESLIAEVSPSRFVLERGANQVVTAAVNVHSAMVAGGHEETVLQFIANGDGGSAVQAKCKTLKRLSHPYLYHNEQQWNETKVKIDKYPKFKPGFDAIIEAADAWEVKPPVPVGEKDYCYDTMEEHAIMSAAYAYALTKDMKYAKKVAAFLRYFTDDEIGYPKKKKGCSQSYVQEGHFFQHLAIPYDIIHSSGALTPDDHIAVEKTFRIYIDILDYHLQQGHISNWLLSEIAGAFYCALAIEDIERALRFVYGSAGMIEHLRYGLFNDGWWHECSVGYNIWVSSMYIHTAHALLPFGINIVHEHFPIPFNDEVNSTYNGEEIKVKFGMYNKKWGGSLKNYVRIKDLFDATIPFLDYRGVMFGISDSDEKKLEGVHFGSTFDLAYTYYRDPEYIPVINQNDHPDPVFGHGELPVHEAKYTKSNAFSDNIGIAMLRSQTEGREQREQIQAVVRYGSHGYAHGHFDRTGLLSVMRYGRSFYNPEHVWWGYAHFMYKFYVQNSITKNMVIVDGKMQVPSESNRFLFYSGEAIQAVGIETASPWSYPPYGGMVYDPEESLAQRCERNASSLPYLPDAPPHGELSGHTEPITQRRVMGVTDDYIVLFDYLQGEQDHQFESLVQIKGFKGLKGENVQYIKHTSQLTDDPLSDGQFVTDCHWYEVSGPSRASFETIFGEGEDMRGTRSFHNTSGLLNMDVHTAWPPKSVQIIGRAAEDHGYCIPLKYRVEVDGQSRASGEMGAWLLGEGKCDISIEGARKLVLCVQNGPLYTEQKDAYRSKQGLFWGEAYIVTVDGLKIDLSELPLDYSNVDVGFGIGKDYEGGRVTIVGNEYPKAIPASPVDHDAEGSISLDLEGLGAVRFVGMIGVDAFPGDEAQRRMTYAVRTRGKQASYVTVIEPYEAERMIAAVRGINEHTVVIELKDGRSQQITVQSMNEGPSTVHFKEFKDGRILREEEAAGNSNVLYQ